MDYGRPRTGWSPITRSNTDICCCLEWCRRETCARTHVHTISQTEIVGFVSKYTVLQQCIMCGHSALCLFLPASASPDIVAGPQFRSEHALSEGSKNISCELLKVIMFFATLSAHDHEDKKNPVTHVKHTHSYILRYED